MKKTTKKLLLFIFTMIITATVFVCTDIMSFADNAGYLTYKVENGEAIITDCDVAVNGSVVIPDTLGGYPVTAIGNKAFLNCENLTEIKIPDSVTSIGRHAFNYCRNLKNINIPDGVTFIGDHTFYYCNNLMEITIPDSVTLIEEGLFYNCEDLEKITLGNGLTAIKTEAFYNCRSLTDVKFH